MDSRGEGPGFSPNARYTAPAAQCPVMDPEWESADGVPISGFLMGGRRSTTVPLVFEAFNWEHGVFLGSIMGSQTTAAAAGSVGKLRRDPFAMRPFCGYHMGAYFGHWLKMGSDLGDRAPRFFCVNWFRQDANGRFLWPGFGDNSRVLKWICGRIDGTADAVESPIGFVPTAASLDLEGLEIDSSDLNALLTVDPSEWLQDLDDIRTFFQPFGNGLPSELTEQLNQLETRLKA